MVRDEEGQVDPSEEEFTEEQSLIARMIHLFENSVADKQYLVLHFSSLCHGFLIGTSLTSFLPPFFFFSPKLLSTIRKQFGAGGNRIKFTLPPLLFSSLRLALRYEKSKGEDELWAKKCQKVFQFSHQTTTALVKANHFDISLRLFLQCAQAADVCQFETIAYEFMTQSFIIYEENIADSKAQLAAITLIIGSLQTMRVFGSENQDTLTTKCALYSSKLLKV